MQSPFARLSFFYAASGAEGTPSAVYPFAPGGAGSGEAEARSMAERLRSMPEAERRPLLRVLAGKASLLPWSALHASWLEEVLASCRPQWRLWALDVLPVALRERLQVDRPAEADPELLEARPPMWWSSWFASYVKRRLGYPDLTPWDRAQGDGALPGALWQRSELTLTQLLGIQGTRGFVSALRMLPPAEAQAWMGRLPAQCQGVASETATRRRWSEDPFWLTIFTALADEFPGLEMRIFRIALADWLRAGTAQGQELPLRRLAFRMPRRWGEWVLAQLDSKPAWLGMPVRPSLEAWQAALAADLEPLVPGEAVS